MSLQQKSRWRRKERLQLAKATAVPARNDPLPRLDLVSIRLDDLNLPKNKTRKCTPAYVREAMGAISALGFCAPILVGRDNLVLDGEVRVAAAKMIEEYLRKNGNYILSAFLGFTAPTGITAFTNRPAWIVTPTIAGGIGFGDFDIQGTVGYTIPTDERNHLGNTLLTSVTFQYHLFDVLWPEFAMNDTQWTSGTRAGRNQLLIGPGIMFGRFVLYEASN